jgi:enoyl-CoA hydratase/carnithine racemase
MTPAPSAAPHDLVRFEHDGGVAVLTLDAPASRNALSLAMIAALSAAVERIDADPDLRVAMIAGVGPALSAGHDLRELNAHRNDPDGGGAFFARAMDACATLMQAIVASPKPFIAVIEGVASAAGCQLVAACDLAVAGANARFALPGVNIGLFCTSPLVAVGRTISRKHAMEMALTGALYSAEEAERFGLVNRVAPAGTAFGHARALALEIASLSAATVALGKRAFYRQIELPLEDAYRVAAETMVANLALPDSAEGICAFLEKRPPRWES